MLQRKISFVTDGAGKKLQRDSLIGTLQLKELEERVRQILKEGRAACTPRSHIA